jgi:hypothetical protein
MSDPSSTIIARIRARTGYTSTQISDADLTTIIGIALDEYSYYKPDISLSGYADVIVTEAGVPNYDIPNNALWIVDAFWFPDYEDINDTLYNDLFYNSLLTHDLSFTHKVDFVIVYDQLRNIKHYFSGEWKMYGNQIYLIPCPDSSGQKVAFVYATAKTLAELDLVKDRLFEELCTALSYERFASDMLNGSTGWRAGSYQVSGTPGQVVMDTANKKLADVRNRLANAYVGMRNDM